MINTRNDNKGVHKRGISPYNFFSVDADKTKINWFLFEFARELEHFIAKEKQLTMQLHGKGVSRIQIENFCIHYAKHIKGEILDKLAGKTVKVKFGYERIEAFFPKIGDRLVDRLLTVAAKAWDSQTKSCILCPTRCISEKDERAQMFDDPYYWK
jgi:hypothetical protein